MVFFVGGEVFEELLLVFDSMLILSVISKGLSILIADFNCNSEVALRYMLSSSGLIILGSYVLSCSLVVLNSLRGFFFFMCGHRGPPSGENAVGFCFLMELFRNVISS